MLSVMLPVAHIYWSKMQKGDRICKMYLNPENASRFEKVDKLYNVTLLL